MACLAPLDALVSGKLVCIAALIPGMFLFMWIRLLARNVASRGKPFDAPNILAHVICGETVDA